MKMLRLILIAVLGMVLAACSGTQTQLRITCADGGGVGSWIGLGGKVNAMTMSTPDHVFTKEEIDLFKTTCPRDNEVATMLQEILATRLSPPQTSPQ